MSSIRKTSEQTTIRPLATGECSIVGEVIADSHTNYPAFTHLFPNQEQRSRVLQRLMTGVARDAQLFGEIYAQSEGSACSARRCGCLPAGSHGPTWRKLKAGAIFLPLLWHTRPSTSRFFALGANAEKAAPAEPHWNLQVLGIRREAQGQGLGSRLLQPALPRADQDGIPCYLETADPANLDFYQRFGFELDRQHQLVPHGPPHYSMRRPPQAKSRSQGEG